MTTRELTSVERLLLSVMVAECGADAVVKAASSHVSAELAETEKRVTLASRVDALTARERQTLLMYGAPSCYKRIATAQGLSLDTVRSNVARVRAKMSLRSQSEAVLLVQQLGLRP